ncbi:MAG: hypothetical protein M1816_006503 [Peltula sp. TS41687]|nr:MAG: hypothetical protein M1816_006503 [Peltula sp. TS41687]
MGSSNSKVSPAASHHVFASESPVRFSQGLMDSLQTSGETDSSRQKTLELHIQSRVGDELKQIEARESQRLKELEDKLSSEPAIPSGLESGAAAGHDGARVQGKLRDLDRENIQREIGTLRQQLEKRKRLRDLDQGVKKAKDDVVSCLRTNDRRPLDCWKEVEAFKREVARLEDAFVERTLR